MIFFSLVQICPTIPLLELGDCCVPFHVPGCIYTRIIPGVTFSHTAAQRKHTHCGFEPPYPSVALSS